MLMKPMKHNGLALALSLASVLHLGLLAAALRRKMGALGWRRIARSIARSGVCAAVMGLSVWWLARWTMPQGVADRGELLAGVSLCTVAGVAVFVGLAMVLRTPELDVVKQIVGKRGQLR
jgi:putative peptidoglycan lipid II flippase